ncbi:DEAD/DEAH box helicase [Arcticibacter eurypsychrophilus]|uniref:DEAD/DEAH box helicase n=1 Tax=Arcticibacter eurypsychrophilus TaxID=1434752 RepID=UPI00084CEBB3|nr:SNF2-related protein [Arcticibacter eurypsychrophilus]
MTLLDQLNNYLASQSNTQLTKGKRIIARSIKPLAIEEFEEDLTVHVPSETTDDIYSVEVSIAENSPELNIFCECPAFESYNDCKHCVAAVITIREDLLKQVYQKTKTLPINPERDEEGYFHFKMDGITIYSLSKLANKPSQSVVNKIFWKLEPGPNNLPHQQFSYQEKAKVKHDIDIVFNGENEFKTHCSCNDKTYPLCIHVVSSFVFLDAHFSKFYFNRFKLFTKEKNEILSAYGLTLDDEEAKDFQWDVSDWGQLTLSKKPSYLIPAGSTKFMEDFKNSVVSHSDVPLDAIRPRITDQGLIDYEIGYLFNFTSLKHIGLELETLFVRDKKNKPDFKKLSLHQESNHAFLQPLSDKNYSKLLEFSDKKIIEWLALNGINYIQVYSNPLNHLIDKVKLKKHYFELLEDLWPELSNEPFIYQLSEGRFSNNSIRPVKVGSTRVQLFFTAIADDRFITIRILFKLDGNEINGIVRNGIILEFNNTLYLPAGVDDLQVWDKFSHGILKFPIADRLQVIRNLILPLQAKYDTQIDNSLNFETVRSEPIPHLLVSEFENKFLVLKPRFQYDDLLIEYDEGLEYMQHKEGAIRIILRNKPQEKRLYDYLRTLHPKFATQRTNLYYYLPFDEVMKGNWFLNMIQQVQEAGYPVYGLQDLKTFRYNTNIPTFDIKAGNEIDWFDLKIEILWGDQQVPLKDIRKAILNKQEAILLDDGTLGLIPDEWLDQYGLMLKIGTEKNGRMQISKLHYSLLDDLGSKLNNEQIELEIAEKKKKLLTFNGVQTYKSPSAAINAQLRPYQTTGFQWLQALDDLGWGGCLADDMGLGKTLQAITFLQYLKEKNMASTQLIVCPTSLIFNWENELNKFCPSLKYHTYYGNLRSFDDDHFEQFDIILTTYGVVRMDAAHFSTFNWHYIILDESQAIKNPDAQVTKVLQLLKAKNRIILSGTPVQNNTYDLFAQFNFINPGFLGQREFFKREFANPIDKFGDKLKSEQLRRMVHPFMLRRTKEQVATDLPDKTETILWCSMNKAQRSLYDEYKNHYRNMLLKKINEEGMGKSGIYVLEGLLRLRQICDHPSLIKTESEVTQESVKTDELMREIQENSGGHKLLVFSQFTEMLHIISKELDLAGLPYCYLDGSTPANKRKDEVNRFQEDDQIKVFLISLKAGGVGLNLTAADYVYLVDPWWNPATEQQAIDRTHRIGQTRKIFAYKMICKDTVEEKILQLQQKKKSLADELINADSSFVKKLTKEDIEFLFS